MKVDMARKRGHLHPHLIYIYIHPLVVLCTKGKNKGVGRKGGGGEREERVRKGGVVKKLLKGWDSGIMNVAKAKPKVKSKCAPVRTDYVVQILSSLQPMRAGNNSAADLSLHHVSVVHVR
jgi:hypothetical protein